MVFGEFLFAMALIAGAVIAFRSIASAFEAMKARRVFNEQREEIRVTELRQALRSRDYRRLDDWVTLYGAEADPETTTLVKERRDEYYIENDDRVEDHTNGKREHR